MPESKSLRKDLKASRISWNKQKTSNADSNGRSIRKGPDCKIPFYPCDSVISSLTSISQIQKVERRHMSYRRPPPRFLRIDMLLNTAQQTNYSLALRENVCSLKLCSNREMLGIWAEILVFWISPIQMKGPKLPIFYVPHPFHEFYGTED